MALTSVALLLGSPGCGLVFCERLLSDHGAATPVEPHPFGYVREMGNEFRTLNRVERWNVLTWIVGPLMAVDMLGFLVLDLVRLPLTLMPIHHEEPQERDEELHALLSKASRLLEVRDVGRALETLRNAGPPPARKLYWGLDFYFDGLSVQGRSRLRVALRDAAASVGDPELIVRLETVLSEYVGQIERAR